MNPSPINSANGLMGEEDRLVNDLRLGINEEMEFSRNLVDQQKPTESLFQMAFNQTLNLQKK